MVKKTIKYVRSLKMISDEIKQQVLVELAARKRGHQHTAAAGILLYEDTNYGDIHFGHSG
ncbi:hypothetical protein BK667_29325 [Pseudomonas frederiksbergensis]|nr:hypothetical protein BK667_29325 [Pseudomonas frederiksbergensis]